jgi:hypothetical protein
MKLKKLLKKLRNRIADESVLAKIDEIERVLSPRSLRELEDVADPVFVSSLKPEDVADPGFVSLEDVADPAFVSLEVQTRLIYGWSINEIFSNCAMYVYGCDDPQADTKILAYNTNVGGHPFKELQLEVVESGTAVLFEIVSNDNWLCFISGMISRSARSGAPMLVWNTILNAGDTFVVNDARIVA